MTGPDDPMNPRPDASQSQGPGPHSPGPDAQDPSDRGPGAAQDDRGVSPVAGRFGGPRSRWITVAALAAGCGAFLFATWDRGEAPGEEPPDAPARQIVPFEPARRPDGPPRLADAAGDPRAPALTNGPQVPALDPAADSGGAATDAAAVQAAERAEARRALAESARRAPVLAYSRGGGGAPAPAHSPDTGPVTRAAEARDGGGSSLERLRQASPIGRVSAGRLPDRRFLITAGAVIPCILETAMDSAAPGQVRCTLPHDVYSDDGSVILLERGSRVLGEYRSGLERGRGRLFVLWTRAVTPGGVVIALASPAADALGRAGFDGRIDSHFWERFGGALLLSAVEGASSAAAEAARDPAAARLPSGAAASALDHSADIPPTLRKDQGAEVSIFVAQDLDFSGVYGLGAP